MKVLQVNCVYKKGSTGKITYDLHCGLQDAGIESIVCYGRGGLVREPGVYKICPEWYSKLNNAWSRVTGIMYGGCFFSTNRLISIIKKERPDIVHLQCINGYFVNIYRLVNWLKKHHQKTVLTLHAEFMYTANCGYSLDCEKWKTGCGHCPRLRKETKSLALDGTHKSWVKMKKAFDGFDTLQLVSCSDWLRKRSLQSPILRNLPNVTIHNGIKTELFDYRVKEKDKDVLDKYGIPAEKKVVLHVTPSFFSEVKGGVFFRELSEMLPSEYQCVVVGCSQSNAKKIIHVPFTQNQEELAALYRSASVFVMVSKCDNYPTVCLEANCCGTPVVGFDVGGVKETIYEGMGEVVPFGDVRTLADTVVKWSDNNRNNKDIEKCRLYNNKQRMAADYIELMHRISVHNE